MSRCIYADVLKEDIAKQLRACKFIFGDSLAEEIEDSMEGVYRTIDRQPTADVVEVKHGRWIDTGSGQECSICKEIQYRYDSARNYCANCGAKMDEREGEDEWTNNGVPGLH